MELELKQPTHAQIPFDLLNAVMGYLATKPWNEVANLMAGLDAAARATLADKPKGAQNAKPVGNSP